MAPVKLRFGGMEDGFQELLGFHTPTSLRKTKDILRISVFMDRGTARQYQVTNSGEESDVREVWNWASQALVVRQLTSDDMRQLHELLNQLPPAISDEPPPARLIVVSFRDDKRWRTRSYDSQSTPEALQKIFKVIESRENRLHELFEREMQKRIPATMPAK